MKAFITSFFVLMVLYSSLSFADTSSQKNAVSYLALGDSYTIGEGVEQTSRWPILLQQSLSKLGGTVKYPEIIARTGWRTDELYQSIKLNTQKPSYDLVTLMIGVNDQYQGVDINTFAKNVERLIKKAINLAGNKPQRVLVISIPDWGSSPYGDSIGEQMAISHDIDEFNKVLNKVAKRYQLTFADVTAISRQADSVDFAEDGLHPSQQQYRKWVDQVILPKIENMINESVERNS